MTHTLPSCRQRGSRLAEDQWVCHSDRLLAPGGLVCSQDCIDVCPYVDHPSPMSQQAGASEVVAQAVVRQPELLAIGMITAPRAIATVDRSLQEVRAAGFVQTVHLYSEPGCVAVSDSKVVIHEGTQRLGNWRNWLRAATSLLAISDAPFVLILEDDIALSASSAAALQYAIDRRTQEGLGYYSLYTPVRHFREVEFTSGWHAKPDGQTSWGALALCFSREALQRIVACSTVVNHAGDRDVDTVVSVACQSLNRTCYYHLPSLCDHVGAGISSLGHQPQADSRAVGFDRTFAGYTFITANDEPVVESACVSNGSLESQVTVVVPTFNCAEFLADCLNSFLQQSVPVEIIVVDDGSEDETSSVLMDFAGKITVICHEGNRGALAAKATGLKAVRSEWVLFADADAVYARGYVAALLSVADPDTDVVYCDWEWQLESGEIQPVRSRPFDAAALWWDNFISMCSLVRSSCANPAFESLRQEPDSLDDWMIWLEIASAGGSFRFVPATLFKAFQRNDGKTSKLLQDPDFHVQEVARIRRRYAALIGLKNPIGVVIPARDCVDITKRCLVHLARYSGLPLSVVYVDNGSSEDTVNELVDHAIHHRIAFATIQNRFNAGFTRAVNQGMRLHQGRHVLCLNNDAFVGPNCIELLYWHLTRNVKTAATGPLTGDSEQQSLRHPFRRSQAGLPETLVLPYNNVLPCSRALYGSYQTAEIEMLAFFCTMLHADAIDECGVLDESTPEFESGLGADDEWCLRVSVRGWQLRLALDAYACHLGSETFSRLEIDRDGLQERALEAFFQKRRHARGSI